MRTIVASKIPFKLYTCISHRDVDWRIRASVFLGKMTSYPEEHWSGMRACAARTCMFAMLEATIPVRLTGGDLVRIILVMDAHLERMKETLKGLNLDIMDRHYNRLVNTRNKVQDAWKRG